MFTCYVHILWHLESTLSCAAVCASWQFCRTRRSKGPLWSCWDLFNAQQLLKSNWLVVEGVGINRNHPPGAFKYVKRSDSGRAQLYPSRPISDPMRECRACLSTSWRREALYEWVLLSTALRWKTESVREGENEVEKDSRWEKECKLTRRSKMKLTGIASLVGACIVFVWGVQSQWMGFTQTNYCVSIDMFPNKE